jgi:hypothetical protein
MFGCCGIQASRWTWHSIVLEADLAAREINMVLHPFWNITAKRAPPKLRKHFSVGISKIERDKVPRQIALHNAAAFTVVLVPRKLGRRRSRVTAVRYAED